MAELAYKEPEPKVVAGATGDWELVIGMEVHAQVASNAKLFSGASTAFGAEPNTNVSLVDAAMPGMLPVINGYCVEQAVRTGLGLKAAINRVSRFDRKNYFYPDLPQGYQISQLYHPIVGAGEVLVDLAPGVARKVRIDHIHLEQDAGKSVHDIDPELSLRRPQPHRRRADGDRLHARPPLARGGGGVRPQAPPDPALPRHLATATCRRATSAPTSTSASGRKGATALGTRCEIKNMNSMRFIVQAIEVEARRQIAILEDGGTVDQETRLYDPNKGETRSMRSKEEAHDYRYFPDPDLLPLELDAGVDRRHRRHPPRAPRRPEGPLRRRLRHDRVRRRRPHRRDASAAYFEAVAQGRDGKQAANWVINELFGRLNKEGRAIDASPVSAAQLGGLIDLVASGEISGKIAKDVFEILWTEGGDPATIVAERGLRQVTDTGAIEAAVDEVVAANPDKAAQARDEALARRLVRRPGDEGDRGQGQPAGRQCVGPGQARDRVSAAGGR